MQMYRGLRLLARVRWFGSAAAHVGTSLHLSQQLTSVLSQAAEAAFPGSAALVSVSHASRTAVAAGAQYQSSCAHAICKSTSGVTGKRPADVASAICEQLQTPPPDSSRLVARAWTPGDRGFINLEVSSEFLSQFVASVACNGIDAAPSSLSSDGKPQKRRVLVDFASPNMCKSLHVGHLRSAVLGDTLSRLLEFHGHEVTRVSHVGDWGTPVAMVIALCVRDAWPVATDPEAPLPTPNELDQWYVTAKRLFDSDADFRSATYQALQRLHAGDAHVRAVWQRLCEASRRGFAALFRRLDVRVEERGESQYASLVPTVLAELQQRRLAVESQGALVIQVPGFPAPLLVRKSDGTALYATTDLAAIRQRCQQGYRQLIYITDRTQAAHFQQVFAIARMMHWADADTQLQHIGFGLVCGPDGKKLSSREGAPYALSDLLDLAAREARAVMTAARSLLHMSTKKTAAAAQGHIVNSLLEPVETGARGPNVTTSTGRPEWSAEELDRTAEALGVGAVRYYDLSQRGDYAFVPAQVLSNRGNTSVYLQYAAARIFSLLDVAAANGRPLEPQPAPPTLSTAAERELALHIARFGEAADRATTEITPAVLCDYLHQLGRRFHTFYESCPVIGNPAERSRLVLAQATLRVLERGLALLGVPFVRRL